ncbi:YheC/YheD family protein [Cohnella pontilimi]|uniref:YheC/YheD family protein n=1 Tax=Cohnella pontilimi TaxID=2564100 RepID=A0A4U0F677_9BACL|nr:YheC/YheD family protein [Cohnella pontilimi]TJY39788.1 YheC/YheD family protein [Cohnella pontilimi]
MQQQKRGRQVASKWLKTVALLASPKAAPHIPRTKPFNRKRLHRMLRRYGVVVLKPVRGGGGLGVMKVSRQGGGYLYAYKSRTRKFGSFRGVWKAVHRARRRRPYLIQQGIDLACYKQRPIDFRLKYMKRNGRWRFVAILGKIAKPGLFVTNICRGGTLVSGSKGLSLSFPSKEAEAKKREMRELTKTCTKLLERRFPGIRQLGYDYGIDRNGHIWILEVNTRPQ